MKWRNGLIGIELMATISVSSLLGIQWMRRQADRHEYTAKCDRYDGCPDHPIRVRASKFTRAALALAGVSGLLVPYAASGSRMGRTGAASVFTAASSLALALGLRYEFVQAEDRRHAKDNAKAGIKVYPLLTDEELKTFFEDLEHRTPA